MNIPGFSRYEIDADGRVTRKSTGEELKRYKSKYSLVYIYSDARKKKIQIGVHILQALANHGEREEGMVASFVDGNRNNLHASNIIWTDRSTLGEKSYTKRAPRRNNVNTPETREMVLEALCLESRPVPMSELACILQVPYSVVRYSMYHLIADGKAKAVQGGYVAI